jgi:LacI family transcriptional regulator
VTIVDVANALGVAPSTVSNALHDKDLVAPSTKARILAKASEMKYAASAAARALVTKRSHSVGVLVPDLGNPVYSEVIKGIDEILSQRGYATLLANTEGNEGKQRAALDAFLARDIDGLAVVAQSLSREEIDRIAEFDLPTILVHRKAVDPRNVPLSSVEFDYVGMDNYGGVGQAVAHLAALGHKRIGMICGPEASSTARERRCGYADAVANLGLDKDAKLTVPGTYEVIGGLRGARELLSLRRRPTAIIAANDIMAFAVMDVAQQMEISIPGDLSVIGFDDIFVSAFPMISLTTIRQPALEIGNTVGKRMLERFGSDDLAPASFTLPAALVVRHSTSAAPALLKSAKTFSDGKLSAYLAARWKPAIDPTPEASSSGQSSGSRAHARAAKVSVRA